MRISHLAVVSSSVGALGQSATTTASVNVPSSTEGASNPIDRSFPGFGFATQALKDFVGEPGKPNLFSWNLIDSVFSRTGGTPILRIGGTDGDARAKFVPTGNHNGDFDGNNYLYSPSYFESYKNFLPYGVKYIFQIPFRPRNVSNTVEFFQAGYNNIGAKGLESVAIGNEEGQLYTNADMTAVNYTAYVDQYLQFENAILKKTNIADSVGFEIADGAFQERSWGIFNPSGMFNNDINKNGRVNAVAYHLYQFNGRNLQQTFMNHSAILDVVSEYTYQLAYMQKNQPKIPYILSEVGNGQEAGADIQKTFGTALWQTDIMLYLASIGVARMNFISSGDSGHNEWVASPKEVRAAYYAHPFVADFIGNSTKDTRSQVLFNETLLTGYAAYDGPNLQRIALVNFKLWPEQNSTAGLSTPRGSKAIELNNLSSDVKSVRIQRLTSPKGGFADQASEIMYDNTQWTADSNGKGVSTNGQTEMQKVAGGAVTVIVNDTEAVLLILNR